MENVIELIYGVENFGKKINGYRNGEFEVIKFYNEHEDDVDDCDDNMRNIAVVGSYEGDVNRSRYLAYNIMRVLNEDFVIYHHKGNLYHTSNITPEILIKAGVGDRSGVQLHDGDWWNYYADNLIKLI